METLVTRINKYENAYNTLQHLLSQTFDKARRLFLISTMIRLAAMIREFVTLDIEDRIIMLRGWRRRMILDLE